MFRLSRQDWSRLQRFTGWQNVVIVEDSSMYILIVETFFYWFAPRSKSAFALQVFSKKNIVKERTTNRKRNVYIQKRGWAAKQREERDGSGKGGRRLVTPLYFVWYVWIGGDGNDQKRRASRRLLSFSSHCSPFSLCFSLFLYLVVPFSNFTLQIPLLTLTKVDAVVIHLANLLQLHYKEYGESLRNLWFLDMFAFLTA